MTWVDPASMTLGQALDALDEFYDDAAAELTTTLDVLDGVPQVLENLRVLSPDTPAAVFAGVLQEAATTITILAGTLRVSLAIIEAELDG